MYLDSTLYNRATVSLRGFCQMKSGILSGISIRFNSILSMFRPLDVLDDVDELCTICYSDLSVELPAPAFQFIVSYQYVQKNSRAPREQGVAITTAIHVNSCHDPENTIQSYNMDRTYSPLL